MNDDEAYALRTVHEQSWLNTLSEATLGSDFVLTDDYWKCFCDHDNGVIKKGSLSPSPTSLPPSPSPIGRGEEKPLPQPHPQKGGEVVS